MAETVRESILANIKTKLSAISVANGYRAAVASVQRWSQHGNTLVSVPCIIISAGEDKWDASKTPVIRAEMDVVLTAWIRQAEDDTNPTDKILNDLLADIFECLWADTTLGGKAIDLDFDSIYPFETIEGNPYSGLEIVIKVLYGFQQSDPETVG